MNAAAILARVNRRLPGYDPSEILDEINAAYKEAWDYVTQLEDSYFTEQVTLTVTTQSDTFDLLYNSNGFLSAAVSPRYFQITRIKVNQPNDTNWIPAHPRNWNSTGVLSQEQDTTQPAILNPPYLYTLYGKGWIKWGRPFPVGTQIQFVYTFVFMPLTILTNGTVSSSTNVVTGVGTNFTQILQPDYQGSLPGVDGDTDVGIELVLQNQTQTYRVKSLTTDTTLTTINPIVPVASAVNYNLASVPDIPEGHHNVIATLATRNFMSTPGNDARFQVWAALSEKELGAMRDSIMQREKQEPPRRGRFPFSLGRVVRQR